MARDVLEDRRHKPTNPTDTRDPPRFAQFIESTKDAFVEELRVYFDEAQTAERVSELPTVEKYAIGFSPGTDPYETTIQIVQEFSDVNERMPHVAVLAAAGTSRRLTIGRPFVAHTQSPPRVVTANQETYALAAAVAQVSTLTVNTAVPAATYTATFNSIDFSYVATAADDLNSIANELFSLMSAGGVSYAAQLSISANVVTLTALQRGVAFTLTINANMTVATPTPAGAATETDQIVFRTVSADGRKGLTTTIPFRPEDFPTTVPITAATATEIARIFNNRALYARARVVDQGGTDGLQLEVGGPLGGIAGVRKSEIEILEASTDNLVTVLGLGAFGSAAGGDAISGTAPAMTLSVLGAGFTAAQIGSFVTLTDATTAANNGRFLITAVPDGNTLEYTNVDGVAEAFTGDWFIGLRDDSTNPLRPKMNRYHGAWDLQVHIEVITEDPNTRRELLDLVISFFSFWLEERHFTLYGRSIFDENVVDGNGNPNQEHWQISIHSEVRDAGDSDIARPDDNKDRIYVSRIEVPVTTFMYIDRPVLVQSGPKTGQSFTLESENITADPNLPDRN